MALTHTVMCILYRSYVQYVDNSLIMYMVMEKCTVKMWNTPSLIHIHGDNITRKSIQKDG